MQKPIGVHRVGRVSYPPCRVFYPAHPTQDGPHFGGTRNRWPMFRVGYPERRVEHPPYPKHAVPLSVRFFLEDGMRGSRRDESRHTHRCHARLCPFGKLRADNSAHLSFSLCLCVLKAEQPRNIGLLSETNRQIIVDRYFPKASIAALVKAGWTFFPSSFLHPAFCTMKMVMSPRCVSTDMFVLNAPPWPNVPPPTEKPKP